MIAGSFDAKLRIYKATNGDFSTIAQTLGEAKDAITSCAISKDGTVIATGSRDNVLRIYYNSGTTFALTQSFNDASEPLWSISISTNKSIIVVSSDDSVVRTYTLCTNSSCFTCPGGCLTC